MTVTDKMIGIACKAYVLHPDSSLANYYRMQAALEAVAPMLIAQGMREAAGICGGWGESGDEISVAILRRAQEIDPK